MKVPCCAATPYVLMLSFLTRRQQTLAYLAPIVQALRNQEATAGRTPDGHVRALVITPTSELAQQVRVCARARVILISLHYAMHAPFVDPTSPHQPRCHGSRPRCCVSRKLSQLEAHHFAQRSSRASINGERKQSVPTAASNFS